MMTAEGTFDEFCELYSMVTAWVSSGWNVLPKVNGAGYRDFETLCSAVKTNDGYSINDASDWFMHAAEVENQEIIRLNKRFKQKLLECENLDAIQEIWNTRATAEKDRLCTANREQI